ncbi:MAG: glycine zipper domain-containing protein [Kiritimatiellia bacterium]
MKKIISIWLAAALATGCASMNDQDKTRAQGAGFGAVAGALLGALIGQAVNDDPASGAIIGGVIGAAGGAVYGDHVAKKKAEFASQEDFLDACMASASNVTAQAVAYNAGLQQELDQMDATIAQNQAAIAAGTASQTDLAALKQHGEARLAEAGKALEAIEIEIAAQKQVLEEEKGNPGGERLARLQQQVEALEAEHNRLQQSAQRLAAINNRMSV